MGEIADDITDGTCCDLCGCYFDDEQGGVFTHGHPATCLECWEDLTKAERKFHQKATKPTI